MTTIVLQGLGGNLVSEGFSSSSTPPPAPAPMGVRYASDVANGTTPFAQDNVAERWVDRNVLNQNPGFGLYPSSAQFGGDVLTNPTRTQGDLALAVNALMAEAWELSKRMPGIFQVSSAGSAPSAPSSQPANVVANESAYLAQLQSLKYNTIRRHLHQILPVMKRLRDNIDGAVGAPGDQSPSARADGRYPADLARGY